MAARSWPPSRWRPAVFAGLKNFVERVLVDMNSLKSSAFLTLEGYTDFSGVARPIA